MKLDNTVCRTCLACKVCMVVCLLSSHMSKRCHYEVSIFIRQNNCTFRCDYGLLMSRIFSFGMSAIVI